MSREQSILATLVLYKIVLLGIGLATRSKATDGAGFFLGGRTLGPWVSALSASASSSSVWTLLGVSGAAYAMGLSALWIGPACWLGFLINWSYLGPRLRRESFKTGALTVTELLAGEATGRSRLAIFRAGSVIVVLSLATYVATQFQGAGKMFQETFGLGFAPSVLLGASIVVLYTVMGGFLAVSITDSLQGFLMGLTSVALPLAAWLAVGGSTGLWQGLQSVEQEGFLSLTGGLAPMAGLGFVAGLLGIGLGYPGQPHVVNRFMAIKDETSLVVGRRIALIWAFCVYAGMLLLGLCGRVLFPDLVDKEVVFVTATTELFPPILAGIMLAAVLSAIMSTADSQLLVVVSSLTHDWNGGRDSGAGLVVRSRWVILAVSAGSVLAALYGPPEIFSFVLFAWSALGAAFGPALLVRVGRGPIPGGVVLTAMISGFALSVSAYLHPGFQGGMAERILPFLVALTICWWGCRRRDKKAVSA